MRGGIFWRAAEKAVRIGKSGSQCTALVYQIRWSSLASFEDFGALLNEEHMLIHSAQQGDREAFAVLVERYWDRLYRWLYHLTHNRHAAEDLVQDTLLKALAGLARFRTGSNFQAWLVRMAYNKFVNPLPAADRG